MHQLAKVHTVRHAENLKHSARSQSCCSKSTIAFPLCWLTPKNHSFLDITASVAWASVRGAGHVRQHSSSLKQAYQQKLTLKSQGNAKFSTFSRFAETRCTLGLPPHSAHGTVPARMPSGLGTILHIKELSSDAPEQNICQWSS